ncbi:MAG: hypothetical protein ABJB05_05140 [Parafilimonas sp.]
MKKSILCISLFFSVSTFAQFHLASFNKDVSNALSKVIEDFPNNFNNIRGDIIGTGIQSTNYTCTVNIDGADSSIIIQNGEDKDNIYSWREVVFETEAFDEAKTKFHEYFNKIKGTSAIIDNKKINFLATYNSPDDSKRFASILFIADPNIQQIKNVVIDLSLQYLFSNWQISISVYEHTDYGVDENQ